MVKTTITYICDRCGKYYDDVTGMQILMKNRVIGLPDDMLDLCPECTRDVEQWLYTAAYYNEKLDPIVPKDVLDSEVTAFHMLEAKDKNGKVTGRYDMFIMIREVDEE